MDLKTELLKEHSKQQALRIANYIGNDPEKFRALIGLFTTERYRISQRAAWPMSICAERHPELLDPHLKKLIANLIADVHPAVKRNTVRALQHIKIPNKLLGIATNNCFNLLASNKEPIAVKVFSMTVLANICEDEPDLKNELKILIENQLPHASPGFKSRAGKILKRL